MNAHRKKLLRKGIEIAAAAFFMLAAAIHAVAAEGAVIMEQKVREDSLLLYVRGAAEGAEARIGTESVGSAAVSDGDIPVVTWLLVDNSISIGESDRTKTRQLFTDLVAGRAANERFNLCTFDEHLNVLVQDSQSYVDLKDKIDSLTYANQETYLTDVLNELLDLEAARETDEYVRVVIVSDGVDNNPEGLIRDEINQRLKEKSIPIYTLGCLTKNNEQMLKEMYALSRLTNGQSWSLSEMSDTLGVTKTMSSVELPVSVTVPIPEKLRDGGSRGVQLVFSDGTTLETQVSMPFGTITEEPEPEPEAEPKPAPVPEPEPEPEPEPPSKLPFIIGGAVLAVVLLGVIGFLVYRRVKEGLKIQPVTDLPAPGHGHTEPLGPPSSKGNKGKTKPLAYAGKHLTIILTDMSDASKHFECPLRGSITIGREQPEKEEGPYLVIDHEPTVSATHCKIYMKDNLFYIQDLGSSNHTYIVDKDGDKQVASVAEIYNGSQIRLGRLKLEVHIR